MKIKTCLSIGALTCLIVAIVWPLSVHTTMLRQKQAFDRIVQGYKGDEPVRQIGGAEMMRAAILAADEEGSYNIGFGFGIAAIALLSVAASCGNKNQSIDGRVPTISKN